MPVETTDDYVRIRQRDPGDFEEGSFRTIDIDEDAGIKAIAGRVKGESEMTIQSYLFAPEKKWTESKAKAWVKKHGGTVPAKAKYDTDVVCASGLGVVTEIADGVPPSEFLLMPRPTYPTTMGTFVTDDESMASIMAAYLRRGVDLPITYEHQDLLTEQNGKEAPAMGWFNLEVRDDGLYAVNVRWTERGAAMLIAREYRYHSPAFRRDKKTNRILEILSGSLVNSPASIGQVPLAAKTDGTTVVDQPSQESIEMSEKILAALGVKDESEAEPAIVALKASIEAGSTEIGALKAEVEKATAAAASEAKIVADVCECVGITDRAALVGACKALSEKALAVAALTKELDEMKAERDAREKATIIEALKISAKAAEWLKDRDLATVISFRDTLGSESVVVHTDVQSASAISTPPSISGDGAEREIMYREWRRMGIAEDKLPARWEKFIARKMAGK